MVDAEAADRSAQHEPVLVAEVLEYLAPRAGGTYIDATVGLGGHAIEILAASTPDGRLLGIDADPEALARTRERLEPWDERVTLVRGWHKDLARLARRAGFGPVDGILFDLGMSSMQLEMAERGFSFQSEGPLDMRMGPGAGLTAEEIVNRWPEEELARIIYEYGEERHSRRIARAICQQRPIKDTLGLAQLISKTLGRRGRIHPATRTFQALRIAVNDELGSLQEVLPQALSLLAPKGRLLVISFHSLEDRIVKRYFRREAKDCICPPELPMCACDHQAMIRVLTKKPVTASEAEVSRNPRSRSAKLRAAERLDRDIEDGERAV